MSHVKPWGSILVQVAGNYKLIKIQNSNPKKEREKGREKGETSPPIVWVLLYEFEFVCTYKIVYP